ncbi:integrin alpha [Tahibacter amnicola]|uniref:Integrin alpha n=1 Tax=Tahibacter amnicola TaxID=2976241 RepID=A0ABY6BMS5_9GAMM|nr:integrin alpha [Tahibacter amnicola]UXI69685.1 integrin alpha [Tahibacter amnicola]
MSRAVCGALLGAAVVQGEASAITVSLGSLVGSNGFRIAGAAAGDSSGFSVSAAGDVNGDGKPDLIIGAPDADPNGASSGSAYVVFGKSSYSASLELSSLNGTNGFRIDGAAANDRLGMAVSGAGDVNGDHIADIIVGAYHATTSNGAEAGASYIIFGRATGFPATLNVSTLNGTNGVRLEGDAGEYSGRAVASAGDINGDGLGDTIIGAYHSGDGHSVGSSYVVFGKSGAFPATINLKSMNSSSGFRLSGNGPGDLSGISVGSAGDLNGDGRSDLLIGAIGTDNHGESSGSTYVVYGRNNFPGNVPLNSLNPNTGFRVDGEAEGDRSGISVNAAGDVNGDGIGDLIIGAYLADPHGSYSGRTYVVFGRQGGLPTDLPLNSIDGVNGFRLNGASDGDVAGTSVSRAGDVNGDGIADILIGAPKADPGGVEAGRAYIMFGKRGAFPATVEMSSLHGTTGMVINGASGGDYAGQTVGAAGDLNGDGLGDVVLGAPGADPHGSFSGNTYVVFGNDTIFANGFEPQQ